VPLIVRRYPFVSCSPFRPLPLFISGETYPSALCYHPEGLIYYYLPCWSAYSVFYDPPPPTIRLTLRRDGPPDASLFPPFASLYDCNLRFFTSGYSRCFLPCPPPRRPYLFPSSVDPTKQFCRQIIFFSLPVTLRDPISVFFLPAAPYNFFKARGGLSYGGSFLPPDPRGPPGFFLSRRSKFHSDAYRGPSAGFYPLSLPLTLARAVDSPGDHHPIVFPGHSVRCFFLQRDFPPVALASLSSPVSLEGCTALGEIGSPNTPCNALADLAHRCGRYQKFLHRVSHTLFFSSCV